MPFLAADGIATTREVTTWIKEKAPELFRNFTMGYIDRRIKYYPALFSQTDTYELYRLNRFTPDKKNEDQTTDFNSPPQNVKPATPAPASVAGYIDTKCSFRILIQHLLPTI